ncbi:hypothetical protein Bbelb_310430 [Branchiostoma belcheri]|nr:hypothetical protein Bbelb_310430 [Branchiostoma belcheri]
MVTAGEYILVVVNGIIIVVTVVGGLLTILAICTRPDLRKLVNVPLVSLSCADILYNILFSPFWIQHILNPHWEPPPALCWLTAYAAVVLAGASLCHMLCIALQSEEVKVDPKLKRCSLGNSDKLWAKIPAAILNFVIPYIAALAFYILIQNHVRKSKNRVQAHAQGPKNRLAVSTPPGGGGMAIPSTSAETVKATKPIRNLEGVEWVGDENGQKGCVEPGKPKGTIIVQVAAASGTGEQQQGKRSFPSNEEGKGIDRHDSDKQKGTIPTITIVSDQAGTHKHQQAHVVKSNSSPNQNSAAERQITKMMMFLFAAYTLCNMPMTVMVIFSSKVPSEAFIVGQLLSLLNGVLNPIIYGVMNKNIRRGYKHIWDRMINFITTFCQPH